MAAMNGVNGASILVDPKEPVALQPRENGPTYFLRVPRVVDRAKFRHDLLAEGGRQWFNLDLVAHVRDLVARLMEGDEHEPERTARLTELDAYAARVREAANVYNLERTEESLAQLSEAIQQPEPVTAMFKIAADHDQGFRDKLADNRVFPEIVGYVAAKLFLQGWEGEGMPAFRRSPFGSVEDAVLRPIPTEDMVAIGRRITELLEPAETRLGNSRSASSGDSDQTSSTEEKTPPPKKSPKTQTPSSGTSTSSTPDSDG
jgi:hypothetical protein